LVLPEKICEIFRKYFVGGTFLFFLSTEEAFLQDDPYGSLKLEASPNSFGIQVLALIVNNFAIEITNNRLKKKNSEEMLWLSKFFS
jgi:hypothetical protein